MDDITNNLIKITLKRLQDKLETDLLPIDQFFRLDEKIIAFSIKNSDEDVVFSVGVLKENTDLLFSNFIIDGSKEDVKKYLYTDDSISKVSNCVENLIKKVNKHYEE